MQLLKSVSKAEQSKEKIEAVMFVINSPGGSPVYSSLMGERIKSFAKTRNLPFYTFAEDVAASGGYWLLCIGDETYAHPASLVGSIGVISAAGAFKGVLEKNKIERYEVSSSDKLIEATFDPFSKTEVSEEIVDKIKSMQAEIFVSFR